jgi:hypothetical protein
MKKDLYRHLLKQDIVEVPQATARARWLEFRKARGYGSATPLLTPPDANTKLNKSQHDAIIYGLSLAPANLSDFNACKYSTRECRAGCVAYAGKGELPNIAKARITKTEFFAEDPSAFMSLLKAEIDDARIKFGKKLAIRLNTFSDIPWEEVDPSLFEEFSDVQFYDYTKWPDRQPPDNYHLTFSASEMTKNEDIGSNTAVVFGVKPGHDLPETFNGIEVIDGDKTDARFLDPEDTIVGLRAKGRMRRGNWKMVRKV